MRKTRKLIVLLGVLVVCTGVVAAQGGGGGGIFDGLINFLQSLIEILRSIADLFGGGS